MNLFEKANFENNLISFDPTDVLDNNFRRINKENFDDTNSMITYRNTTYVQMLKTYNYNKIFNINNPPIKHILEPYIDNINNFYLFFVVSNNDKTDDGVEPPVNTCDKQMQLLYDTREALLVMGDPTHIPTLECKEKT